MITTRIQTTARLLVATLALAAVGLAAVAAPHADAAGLRNCVDILGPQSGRAGCYEEVWSDGVEYRMVFSNTRFTGTAPAPLDAFYLVAPQSDSPQGWPPNTFPHDHVVRDIPAGNGGTFSVRLQGIFVLCSGQGIVSGACVPSWTQVGENSIPFAESVNGQSLTSAEAIESAAAAGDLFLSNLGPGAVIVGSITRGI
jgi:hypothetical protein